MKQLITYIGLDVHKETIAVALAESGRLNVISEQFRMIVTERPKLAGRVLRRRRGAPAPARLIEGRGDDRLIAHVLAARYADHPPLYR